MRSNSLCATACLFVFVATPVFAQNAPTSVRDGVFTDEQAERGSGVYAAECAPCHGPSPELGRFAGQPLSELHSFIRANMPDGAPGTLSADDYAAVTAYLLRSEGFPAGDRPLPTLSRSMSGILFDYPSEESLTDDRGMQDGSADGH